MGWMRSNIALREGRYVTGVQGTLVDVPADDSVAVRGGVLIASVAGAGVGVGPGRGVVGARRVGVAVVGPVCDRGAKPLSSPIAPKRGKAI